MKNLLKTVVILAVCFCWSCKTESVKPGTSNSSVKEAPKTQIVNTAAVDTFAYGSDVSWLTQMEASGIHFYDNTGTQQDLFTILKGKGITSIRLRVWVNPSAGWCNTRDVIAKAKRAMNAGMNILIDFHYSDTWADPGHQAKPAAWAGLDFNSLMNTVYNYTYNTLDSLKLNGITPTWVQVGNETSNGMLWDDGKASLSATNFKNFAWLVNCGYNATKAIFPSTKVIVHIANGSNNTTTRWIFDGLKTYGAHWDICGLSVYPTSSNWSTIDSDVLSNMQDIESRYGKQVMICEAGMSVSAATACKSFLTDLISKTKSVSGLGVFYWEPEAYNNWQGYTMGAFDSSGKPTVAMDAFIH